MTATIGKDVEHAAQLLRTGRLVAFATETVYGLGANALNESAVAKVFAAKNRPKFDPLIVHIHNRAQLDDLVTNVNETTQRLIDRFWPGPLTLVLPKTDSVPDLVTAGLNTVAVRMPDHPQALELLREANVPVAAPSANPFGCISPTTAAHVAEQLGDAVDYILDGGPCRVGVESTVVSVGQAVPDAYVLEEDGEPGGVSPGSASVANAPGSPCVLLRPGGVSLEDLEQVVGRVALPDASSNDENAQPSPGMLSRHYAPRTTLEIHDSIPPVSPGDRIGLMTLLAPRDADAFAGVEVLSPTGDLTAAAANFYAALRRLDALGLDRIIATPFPAEGLGRALNDRLRRAAA